MKTFVGRGSNFGVKFTKKEGFFFFTKFVQIKGIESSPDTVISNCKQTKKSEKPLTSVVLLTMSVLCGVHTKHDLLRVPRLTNRS